MGNWLSSGLALRRRSSGLALRRRLRGLGYRGSSTLEDRLYEVLITNDQGWKRRKAGECSEEGAVQHAVATQPAPVVHRALAIVQVLHSAAAAGRGPCT